MKVRNKVTSLGTLPRLTSAITLTAILASSFALGGVKPVNNIRVNQEGYLPTQPKVAVYLGPANANWELRNSLGQVVASGQTLAKGYDNASGDTVSHIDFSDYNITGQDLTLHIGTSKSYPFNISPYTYTAMKTDAMTYFYHQRFGMPVLAELVGEEYAREAGHLMDSNLVCDDALPADWDSSSQCSYSLDVRGGHQDAGDYGGYVTNGGYYTWLLHYVYESLPSAFPDGSIPIPENNNGLPDILDEARYELDFIMRMQVPQDKSPYPGMLHHKKSWQAWAPFPLVPADDNGIYWGKPASKRTIKPVSTSATLNGAAVMAQGSRIWSQFPDAPGFNDGSEPYYKTLLRNAEIAWDAAVANPSLYASSDASMGSGPYDDKNLGDEFYWAAAELYLTTKKAKYKDFLINSPYFAKYNELDWQLINVAGSLSLVLHDATSGLTTTQRNKLKDGLKDYANATLSTVHSEGYLAPIAPKAGGPTSGSCKGTYEYTYPWGAVGSYMLSNGLQMAAAHKLTGDSKFLGGVTQTMDHVLGTNALDRAYMTGYGENPTTEPHHRFWLKSKGNPVTAVASAVSVPYPAAMAGGPQNQLVEDGTSGPETDGTPCLAPAKSYADHWNNYSSNEITVNWNANLTAVLAFIEDAVPAPSDNVAPEAPQGLNPIATSGSSINVNWNPAQDNNRIHHYNIFMKPEGGDYALAGTTKTLAFAAVPLFPATNYCFKVSAEDYAGLVSPMSAEQCATTNQPKKYEIYYQPDNSAMSDYVGTGAINAPEAPTAKLGNGWYQYQFHSNGPRFDFHFSMPNWGSPQRFSPTGTGTNWKIETDDFNADGVIWLTADKQFHKSPPGATPVGPCTSNCSEPNMAPSANNQSVNVAHNTAKIITLTGSDSDGTVTSYLVTEQPSHGMVTLAGNKATYTPTNGYSGADQFLFQVIDNDGDASENATVSVTVATAPVVVNLAPMAEGQSVNVAHNTAKSITLSATDSDGTVVSYRLEQQPANGTVTLTGNMAVYTPTNQYAGEDSFTFSALDNDNARSAHATINLTVAAAVVDPGTPNIAPVANGQSVSTEQNTAISITLTASDSDGTIASYRLEQQPLHGTVSLVNNVATYTPNVEYFGDDNFKFSVTDNEGANSANATVNIAISETVVVDPTDPVIEPEDEICTVANTTWNGARAKFTEQCVGFTRKRCEPTTNTDAQWIVCSSEDPALIHIAVIGNEAETATRVEAESYARASDSTKGNTGGMYRAGDVDIDKLAGNGYVVGWIANGEQLHYDVLVTNAGNYKILMRTASPVDTGNLNVLINGDTTLSNLAVTNTQSFATYTTTEFELGELDVGSHALSIVVNSGGFNLDWFELIRATDTPDENEQPTDPIDPSPNDGNQNTTPPDSGAGAVISKPKSNLKSGALSPAWLLLLLVGLVGVRRR